MFIAPQEIRTFFITAVTANRRPLFSVESNAQLLITILEENQTKGRFRLHAYVVMTNHVHLLLTPAPDVSLEKAVQYIKGNFSFRIKSRSPVWQPSFTSRRVKDVQDHNVHLQYIHQNPIRAGLCSQAEEFPYSSASRFIPALDNPSFTAPLSQS